MRNLCSSSVCQRSYIREALLARSALKRDGEETRISQRGQRARPVNRANTVLWKGFRRWGWGSAQKFFLPHLWKEISKTLHL